MSFKNSVPLWLMVLRPSLLPECSELSSFLICVYPGSDEGTCSFLDCSYCIQRENMALYSFQGSSRVASAFKDKKRVSQYSIQEYTMSTYHHNLFSCISPFPEGEGKTFFVAVWNRLHISFHAHLHGTFLGIQGNSYSWIYIYSFIRCVILGLFVALQAQRSQRSWMIWSDH